MTDQAIRTRLQGEIDQIESLSYADIDGLVELDDDWSHQADREQFALDSYQENAINNLFDEVARDLGISFDELTAIWRA